MEYISGDVDLVLKNRMFLKLYFLYIYTCIFTHFLKCKLYILQSDRWIIGTNFYRTHYFRKNSFFLVCCVTTDKFWFWKKFCWWEASTGLYTFCELWSLFNILVVGCRKYKLIKLCFHLKISHCIPGSHFSWFAANKRLYWRQWKWKVLMSFTQLLSASVKPNHKKYACKNSTEKII